MKRVGWLLALLAFTVAAQAKTTLRMATVVPDGTNWARELRAFAREVSEATNGEVAVKFYFGGIAGDDVQVLERIKRDQLDGGASGILCERLAPSLRAMRIPGLFRSYDELRYVAGVLRPVFEEEFTKNGFAYFGHAILGQIMVASRQPIRSLADLKKTRVWTWDVDEVTRLVYEAMGLQLKPAALDAGGPLYTDGGIDGFLATPSALLAFQWSAHAHYITDVRANYLLACLMLSQKSYSKLPLPHQQIIAAATAKLSGRIDAIGADQDEKLMGGLFGRQGLQPVSSSDAFRKEFLEAARVAAETLGDKLVPRALFKRVNDLLTAYRAQHPGQARR
jgi:TRAP-type C4-dicarboxylate transport system substrate-binding protein